MSAIFVENLWTFLLLTCVIGGAAAFATGRAIALTWRPFWQALAYMIPLTGAVRFLHYALFGEDILAVGPALLAFVILLAFAALGFRLRQVDQMVRQYPFLFRQTGRLAWRSVDDQGRG